MKSKIARIGSKVKIKYVKDRPGHDVRYALNSKKIKKKLNWKADVNISLGLSKTIDWYMNNIKYFKSMPKKSFTLG